MATTIWHNPRCSKSRATLALLEERGLDVRVVRYLESPPDAGTLAGVLDELGIGPRELMRQKEAPYAALNLADPEIDRDALIDAMVKHPVLIERPVVIHEGRVAIGRPPENVIGILE